ncbi:MAG: hypothetical protein ACM34A_16370, partial [Bacillota bacterium]
MKAKTTINTEKKAADRPSLYSFNSREQDSGDVFRILDALEPRMRRSAIWWRAALVGLVGALAGTLYLVGSDVDVYHRLSPAASNEATLGRTVLKQEAPKPQPVSVAAAADDPGTATIVVEEPLPGAEPQASVEEPPANLAQFVPPEERTEGNGTGVAVSAQDTRAIAPENVGAGQIPGKPASTPVSKQGSRPAPRSAVAAKAVPPQRTGKDGDVDLIAALVSHVSHGDSAQKENRKKTVKPATDARLYSAGTAGMKHERRSGSSRDIVVRNDGDSTEALVARCRALGLIEGELCRVRICSGLWGIDPACPGTPSADAQSSSGR